MPRALPERRRLVYASGVAELVCAAGLLAPATRAAAGWGSAAVLVGVFPANVQMTLTAWKRWRRRPDDRGRAAMLAGTAARLPLQWPLVARRRRWPAAHRAGDRPLGRRALIAAVWPAECSDRPPDQRNGGCGGEARRGSAASSAHRRPPEWSDAYRSLVRRIPTRRYPSTAPFRSRSPPGLPTLGVPHRGHAHVVAVPANPSRGPGGRRGAEPPAAGPGRLHPPGRARGSTPGCRSG